MSAYYNDNDPAAAAWLRELIAQGYLPPGDVDVLAVAIDGPWLKLAEAVDYVRAVGPRVAVPIHEGETVDPGKYAGMLGAFSPDRTTVRRLARGEATGL